MNAFDLIKMNNRIKENEKNIEKLRDLSKEIRGASVNLEYMISTYTRSIEAELKSIWNSEAAKVFFNKIDDSKRKYAGILKSLQDADRNVKNRISIISENTMNMRKEYKYESEKYAKEVREFNESRR